MKNVISNRKTSVRRILFSLICTFLFFSMINGNSIIHAEDTGSITINTPTLPAGVSEIDSANKPSYTVYKIFDGNSNGTNIRYTLSAGKNTTDAAWTSSQMGTYFDVDTVGNVKIKEGAYTSVDGKKYLTEDAVNAVKNYVTAAGLTGTQAIYDAASKSYKLSNLSDGYYYISTSTGSVVMINSINGQDHVTIQDKNTLPSVDKKQTTDVDSTGKPVDSSYSDHDVNVATGDTIYYEAIVNVPSGINEDIVLSDHLSVAFFPNFKPVTTGTDADENTPIRDGDITVQYQNSSGTWQTLEKENNSISNYVITANWTADDKSHIHGFTVHIKPTDATKGKTLRFLYSATVGGGFMNDNSQDKDASDKKLIDQKRNKIELTYKNYRQEDKVFFHTDCAGAIKYDTSTGDVDPTTNVLSAKEGKTLKYLSDARFKLQERLKTSTSDNDWKDTPVVCNGQREFYRPAVLDFQKTESQHKWIGADGDNVLDYQSENNGFIQANEGELDGYNRGWIVFRGLDPDKQYRLVECSAPDGYNRLTAPVVLNQVPDTKFKVSLHSSAPGEDGAGKTGKHEEYYWRNDTEFLSTTTVVKICNTPGIALPTTGGTGTVIFYLAGGVLIIAAAILLITRRKRNA